MAVAQGTPFYDVTSNLAPDATSRFPLIYSIDATKIHTIDYRPFVSYSTPSGSAPSNPSTTGDGLEYLTNISNGAPAGSNTASAAENAFWGSIYINAGDGTHFGYPGPGSTAAIPYGPGGLFAGVGIGMVLQPSGYIVICDSANNHQSISGGVSAATSGTNAELWVLNPTTCKAVYDVIPALSGSPTFICGVIPCADGVHLLVLTGTSATVATKWHILTLTSSGATELSVGSWTSGPENMTDSDNFTSSSTIPVGSSTTMNGEALARQNSSIVGMLESDLVHLWLVCSSSEFYVLQLAGGGYTTQFHGLGGRNGTTPFVKWLNTGEFSTNITVFADKGAGAGMVANLMAYWTYLAPGPQEIDVAKEAIAGDASWRTIFCGFDVPRFTDLGLASGLTSGGNPVTGSSTVASNPGPYPIYYRKLGVSNPTTPPAAALVPAAAGSNAVNYLDTFDNPIQWNLPPNTPNSGGSFQVVGGNPGAYMLVQSIGATTASATKQFAIDQTIAFTVQTDFSFIRAFNARLNPSKFIFLAGLDTSISGSAVIIENTSTGVIVHFASISNGVIGPDIGTFPIASGSIPSWHVDTDPTFTGFIQSTQFAHVTLNVVPVVGSTTSATITMTVKIGATTEFTASQTGMPVAGPGAGVGTFAPVESYPDWLQMKVDNFQVSGTGPAAATQNLSTTTYLYTLVNDLGEESGPSNAMLNTDGSNFITRPIGQGVQVTLPGTLAASGADPTYFDVDPVDFTPTVQLNGTTPSPSMNLYRAVTGSNGTQFLLVAANIAFSGGTSTLFTDQLPDSALSQVIPSLFTLNGVPGFWSPPPVNMLGILALPNGIYAGFHKNVLDLAVQNVPHAWPIIYQLAFDYDIVGIEAVDTTVVVLTKKFPYLCSGNTPDQFSQTRATYPYACASKRSIKYLKGKGVVFASFEGLVAIAGVGNEVVLTEGLFSKKEWLALNPASMIADINDGRYFCSFTTLAGQQGAFYIDIMDAGAGKVSLGWHFTARYNDPLTDTLHVIPDFIDPAAPIGVPTGSISAFETAPASPPTYVWKSKQFFVQWPTTYRLGRITADTYANLALQLFADGVAYGPSIPITSQQEFGLPQPPNGTISKYFEFQLTGTDKVNRAQFVEDVGELE